MESYTNFSEVYDTFMDQTSYEEWADLFMEKMRSGGREFNPVVDLGCGTGRLTELLAERGCDITGVDLSEDMLAIAEKRKLEKGSDTFYVCQDMRQIELPGLVQTFVSAGDSVNYLLTEEDLMKMFQRVSKYLTCDGLFIFDFKTLHLYRDVIGDDVIAEDREDCSFIWDNYFHEENHINEYDLSLFIRRPELGQDVFQKYEEIHFQRGYTIEEMTEAAGQAHLVPVSWSDSDDHGPVRKDSERVLAVFKKE